MPSKRYPQRSRFYELVIIQAETDHRRPAGGCLTNDVSATVTPSKLICPSLLPRIEERD